MRKMLLILSVTQATREKTIRVPPTGVEPMTFRTPVGRSTTELQETRGSLGHITRFQLGFISIVYLIKRMGSSVF